MKKTKQTLPDISTMPILKPVDISSLGNLDTDPCFGKEYDLSTKECKMCGDSELCCIKFADKVGKTRKQLEKENQYKDLEILVDKSAVFKSIRALKRKGDDKKTIIQKIQVKYELSIKEARLLYKEQKLKSTK